MIAEKSDGVPTRLVVVPLGLAEKTTKRHDHPDQGLSVDARHPGNLPAHVIPDWLKASCACVVENRG